MEYDAAGLVSRRQRGAGFNEVVSAYQRDIADLDQDGSTTDYVPLTPLYDGAYDCIGVLDHIGAIAESYAHTYDGAVTITSAAGGAIPTSAVGWQQGYGCMYRDGESGLLYAVHRYYCTTIGRALSEDPMGRWSDCAALGSGYVWLGNRYRNGWDPLGLRDPDAPRGPTSRAEADQRARIANLYAAMNFIEKFGPEWAKKQLAKRRKYWKSRDWPGNPWGIWIQHMPSNSGWCANEASGEALIVIDDDAALPGRDRGKWGQFLSVIYHELMHDYEGQNDASADAPDEVTHPALPGITGAGTGEYNNNGDAYAESTMSGRDEQVAPGEPGSLWDGRPPR